MHHSMLAIAMVSSECDSVHRRSIAMHRLACAAVHTVCVLHLVDSRGCAKMRGQFHCAPSPKSMPKIRPQEFCQGLFVHCPYSLRRTPHLQCACPAVCLSDSGHCLILDLLRYPVAKKVFSCSTIETHADVATSYRCASCQGFC